MTSPPPPRTPLRVLIVEDSTADSATGRYLAALS